MQLSLILPLLAVSLSFETACAKDFARGDARLRARALQEEFSVPVDLSVAGIVPAVFADGHGKNSTKSRKSSKSNKSGGYYGLCDKRLEIAFEEAKLFPGPFPNVATPEDVSKLCAFIPPNVENQRFNLGCPFLYTKEVEGKDIFPKGVDEYIALSPEPAGEAAAQAFASVALYCSCYQDYNLGCSKKLPTTPQEKDDYCAFVGVWNGDISSSDVELGQTTLDCGCFWINKVTTKVEEECSGVDLGYFYTSPGGSS
jgi:hypothetical protein